MGRRRSVTIHNLTQSLKTSTKSLGRRNPEGIARQVMAHEKTRNAILKVATNSIKKELTEMCKLSSSSMLRDATLTAMTSFNWNSLVCELKERHLLSPRFC